MQRISMKLDFLDLLADQDAGLCDITLSAVRKID